MPGGTHDGTLLATASGQRLSASPAGGWLNPIVPPSVIRTNPARISGPAARCHQRDLRSRHAGGRHGCATSVTNPNNYELVGDAAQRVPIQQVLYDADSRTALLLVGGLTSDHFTLTVHETIRSAAGVPFAAPYTTEFRTIGDLTGLVSFSLLGRDPTGPHRLVGCTGHQRQHFQPAAAGDLVWIRGGSMACRPTPSADRRTGAGWWNSPARCPTGFSRRVPRRSDGP
jgi:hypothetical protein